MLLKSVVVSYRCITLGEAKDDECGVTGWVLRGVVVLLAIVGGWVQWRLAIFQLAALSFAGASGGCQTSPHFFLKNHSSVSRLVRTKNSGQASAGVLPSFHLIWRCAKSGGLAATSDRRSSK